MQDMKLTVSYGTVLSDRMGSLCSFPVLSTLMWCNVFNCCSSGSETSSQRLTEKNVYVYKVKLQQNLNLGKQWLCMHRLSCSTFRLVSMETKWTRKECLLRKSGAGLSKGRWGRFSCSPPGSTCWSLCCWSPVWSGGGSGCCCCC